MTHLDELVTRQSRFAELVAESGLHFEGRPFPMSVRALVIAHERAAAIQQTAERLHGALSTVADLFATEDWIRARFPTYPAVHSRLMDSSRAGPSNLICRFDGAIDKAGDFRLFETNSTSPGGVIQTGIAARLWRQAADEWGIEQPERTTPQPLVEDLDLFGRTLVQAHTARVGRHPETAAIVNHQGRFTNEVDLIRPAIERLGVATDVVDARDIRRGRGGRVLSVSGQPLDFTYNKLSAPELMVDAEAGEYLRAAVDGTVSFFNPLISVCVLDDKAVLSVLTDERFTAALAPELRELVRRHVPWTRLLAPGKTTDPDGAPVELAKFAASAKARLVVKPTTRTRGEGVLIGRETPPEQWQHTVESALGTSNHVVQEYVELPRIDVPMPSGVTTMAYGLDTYLFAGRCVGLSCRASLDGVVNLGKRGALLPVVIKAATDGEN